MPIFALDTTKKIVQFAMPAEKAIPTPHSEPLIPAEKQPEAIPHVKEEPKTAEYVEKTTKIFTGLDYGKMFVAFSFLAVCVFFLISTRNQWTSTNQNLQDIQVQTAEVSNQKSNLSQEVHELSNYDRVMQIAEDKGLAMNEENIRNVEK